MRITEKAKEKIKFFLSKEKEKVFRITVETGGCNGLKYKTELSQGNIDDVSIDKSLRTVTDPISNNFLSNSTLDYTDSIGSAGFVFYNSDAKGTCGCGMSFDI